ncbi:MAG: ABC transporter ATP-binding protein [Reyranella sp.]|nr:ABC transporter ATP-binding protein [Reyranella sp.]
MEAIDGRGGEAVRAAMLPRTIMGYVLQQSGTHQVALALLSVAVFALSAVPLELQRRIVNDAIGSGAVRTILLLALAYAGVAVVEQSLKLALNVYRAWVSERAVRALRRTLHVDQAVAAAGRQSSDATGIEIAMIVEEAQPVGGFVGISISEPLLQGGILASVIGYMIYLEPWMAALCPLFFLPQLVFVPLMQWAINRRAAARIRTMRDVSSGIAGAVVDMLDVPGESARIDRVFALNMGIYKFKYSMNLAMNLMYYFSVAAALGVGGWFAVEGRIEVGTVVAIVSGLGKLNDPWGDLVNWGRELSVVGVKYRLFADAVNGLARRSAG